MYSSVDTGGHGYLHRPRCWVMHDEIFHFEIFQKFHGNFEIFQDHFIEIFHEIFNFRYEVT